MNKTFLVTGGAGFIGSAVIRHIINKTQHKVVNVDKLTYAGNLKSLEQESFSSRYVFEQVDICDFNNIQRIFKQHKPDVVMHLAAESHVDRSIDKATDFIQTNIVGTYTLLDVGKQYWNELDNNKKKNFRFHHVSTDEVYGDLENPLELFTEKTPYAPSSPYSASKASSDHLVRAWFRTYNFPIVITNCSNNYGPYQYPEKLIPVVILNALQGKAIPVYGQGKQIRDWLYVDDHVEALLLVAQYGKLGETYNIGGNNEVQNIDLVNKICEILNDIKPSSIQYQHLIKHVTDRPGHDLRYAIDASKISKELNWQPLETIETGLIKTVKWYLDDFNTLNGTLNVLQK